MLNQELFLFFEPLELLQRVLALSARNELVALVLSSKLEDLQNRVSRELDLLVVFETLLSDPRLCDSELATGCQAKVSLQIEALGVWHAQNYDLATEAATAGRD